MKKLLLGLVIGLGFVATGAYALSIFQPVQGGTGISTIPTYGQVLVGNVSGTYTLTATSALGITGGGGSGASTTLLTDLNLFSGASNTIAFFNSVRSTTTQATSTSLFSTLLRATTGYFTSLFLPSLATPAGSLVAVDANGQFIATNTPSGSVSGGTAGMLTSWVNSTTLTSTSGPTFGYFTGTSTATSSLAGALSVKRLSIGTDPTVLTSSSTAVDGSPGLLFHYPGATNYSVGAVGNYIDDNNYSGLAIQSNAAFNADLFGFNNGSAAKITSVGIIPQSNGTAPTTFNVNGDTSILGAGRGVGEFLENWNDGAFSFNGLMIAVTDIASDASSRLITAEVGGQERFSVGKTGNLTLGNASNKATFDVSALSGSDKTITVQNKTGTLVVSTPTQANTDSTSWTAGDATGVDQQGSSITIFAGDATNGNAEGGGLTQFAGNGIGTGGGGGFELQAGTGGATGNGGAISITAGSGGATSGDGADLTLFAGGTTAGSVGHVKIGDPTSFVYAKLGTSLITADRTFEFPDSSGTLCTTVTCAGGSGASSTLLTDANTFTGSTSINTLTTIRSTSTQATSTNFFSSILTATSGFFTNLFVTGSSTLQDVTMRNATTTNATTTSLAATTICLIGDTCRTTWPAGAGSSYPFYTLSTAQATNTPMAFTAGALGTYFSGTSTATSSFVNFNGEFWATSTSVDIGKQVMNYYNNYCWGDMCIVNIPKGSYTQNVATYPMNFNTAGKRISLRCAEGDGTIINLTGAGTSTRINAGNGGTLALLKTYDAVVGCTFSGNLTAGQVGIEIGGSNGAQGAMVRKTSVFTTDKGISFSANTNAGASLIDSNSQYNNKNLAGEMSGDGGEGIEIINSNLSDCQSGHTLKCVDFSTTQGSSVHIINSEIDDAELYVADGNLNLTVENSHLENPDTALTGQYNFIRTGSGGYGALTLIGNTFWNGGVSSALSPYSFIYAGNPVRMMGNSFGSNGARIGSVIQTYGDGRVEATGNFYPLNTVAANNIPVFSTSTAVDFMVDPVGHGVGIGTSTGNSGLSVVGNVYVSGSTTLQNFTGLKATTTAATTTSLAVTSVTSALHLANATGGVQAYGGTSCTNQFVRSLNGGGAATCATVANTDLANSAITINGTSVSLGGTITVSSTTLLANNNTFSGANSFATMLVTGSTTLQNFTGLRSTTTEATTTSLFATNAVATNLRVTNAPIFTALTGILKGNGASALTVASNGTDYTLITANTCGAGQFFNQTTAAGVFTCGTPSGGGGASSTLLADANTFTGANIFNNITRSTTTDATTTNIFATKASTSAFFGAGLTSCVGASDSVTYANGSFGCHSITSGSAASTTLLADNNTFSGVNNFTGKVGFGSSSPDSRFSIVSQASTFATLHIKQTSTDSSFAVYGEDEFGDVFYIDQYMSFYNTVAGIGLGVVPDGTVGALTLGTGTSGNGLNVSLTTSNRVGVGSSSPSSLLSVQGILGSQSPLFIVATTTGSNSFGSLFSVMANGTIMSTSPSGTTTKNRILNEPDGIAATAVVANYTATYSDDLSRMLACGAIASTGVIGVRNGSFAASGVTNVYLQTGTAQQLTAATMANGVTTIIPRGCVTAEGYHYVFLASTTNAAATAVRRATSSDFVNIAAAASWGTSTVSGVALATTGFLVGYERGTLYIATSTTAIAKYTVGTTSNTLTYAGTITITGANITFANTRVNDNGIYVGFAAAPMIRKYTLAGVAVNGANYVLTAIANGPDFLAMKNSVYAMSGGSTVFMSRIFGY